MKQQYTRVKNMSSSPLSPTPLPFPSPHPPSSSPSAPSCSHVEGLPLRIWFRQSSCGIGLELPLKAKEKIKQRTTTLAHMPVNS